MDFLKNIDEKINRNDKNRIIANILAIILLSFILEIISFAFSTALLNLEMIRSYFKSGLLLLMNFIPIFLMIGIIWLVSNKLWLGFTITGLLIVIGGIANKTKLIYRDDPVIFSDITLISEAGMMAQKYKLPLSPRIILTLLSVIVLIFVLKNFFNYKIDSKKTRIIMLLIMLILTAAIFGTFYFKESIYTSLGDEELINIWISSERHQSKGFVYPFLYSFNDLLDDKLENYDKDKAIKDLEKYSYDDIEEDKKVNVISIMFEAYNDFSKFDTVDINEEEDVYRYFHELQKESAHGELITNVFAGNTIMTERSFLTGYQNHPKYNRNTNSFVWYLKEQGYFTQAMHPITGSFYNRKNINEYLGFDQFDYKENKYEEASGLEKYDYLRDISFFDYIIEGYEESKKEGTPYFNFSVTYQNHGPYSDEKYHEIDFLNRKEHYTDAKFNIINNYLKGIGDTDKAMEKLIEYFREEDEPVIVVFFGDHNPWLGEGNSVYKMLDIDMDLGKEEGFKNYYSTPYLIWGNDKAKEVTGNAIEGKRDDIGPGYLMAQVFEELGWKGNEYLKYIDNFKSKVSVHHKVFFNEEGKYTKELNSENYKLWQDYRNVEHYYARNYRYKGEN